MCHADVLHLSEVCDTTRELEDFVVTARTDAKPFEYILQSLFDFFAESAYFYQIAVTESGVDASLAFELQVVGVADTRPDIITGLTPVVSFGY